MKHAMRYVALATALILALPAAAHPGHDGGLAAGLLHPLTGLDHLLALLAVGLWSRRQRHGVLLSPVFLVLMALGASCAGMLVPGMLPALETSIAATVLLLGVVLAGGLRMPPQPAVALVGLCGFLHGLAHGRELAGMASGAGYLVASALVMGVGMVLAPRLDQGSRRQVTGAAIGAVGLCLLAGFV